MRCGLSKKKEISRKQASSCGISTLQGNINPNKETAMFFVGPNEDEDNSGSRFEDDVDDLFDMGDTGEDEDD